MASPPLTKFRKLQEEAQALLHERTLPLPDDAGLGRTRGFLLFCARVYHSFVRNRCPVRAAALAYTNLLALVPLLAVAVSVSASMLKQQSEQNIQDWIKEMITKVAPSLGLHGPGANIFPLFAEDDIKDADLERLIPRLVNGRGLLTRYLWDERFSPTNKTILTNSAVKVDDQRKALVAELNQIIVGSSIYDTSRFAITPLSKKSTALARQDPKGTDLQRLNRWLLTETLKIGEDPLEEVVVQISSFVANFQSGKLGVSAVLALIFVAISLLATVESTFNDIWGVTRGRGWFARVVQYWAALTLGPMFLISAVTVTTWAKVSKHAIEGLPLAHFFLPFLVPLAILSLGCALLYLVMPNTKVPWQAALLGGVVAGGLLQLNSLFNVLYVSRVLTYRQIYGSMAALPLFLLGLYFSWLLVLLGGQVAYAFQNRRTYVQEKRAENIHQRGREFAALRLMTHIGQRFQTGGRPPTGNELTNELNIPLRLVAHIMNTLLQAGMVNEVAGGETGFAPARPLSGITVGDILQAMRASQGQDLVLCNDSAESVVTKEFEVIERAWHQAAKAISLEDIVGQTLKT